jgi:hypothetical protein
MDVYFTYVLVFFFIAEFEMFFEHFKCCKNIGNINENEKKTLVGLELIRTQTTECNSNELTRKITILDRYALFYSTKFG